MSTATSTYTLEKVIDILFGIRVRKTTEAVFGIFRLCVGVSVDACSLTRRRARRCPQSNISAYG